MAFGIAAALVCGISATVAMVAGIRHAMKLNAKAANHATPHQSPAPNLATPFSMHGITTGDVLLLRDSTEAWLTSAVQLRDDGEDDSALFFFGDGEQQSAIVVRNNPREMFVMQPAEVPNTTKPPSTIEYKNELLTRKRTLPVEIQHHRENHPLIGNEGTWSWFSSPSGNAMCCLHTDRGTAAWFGNPFGNDSILHLAAGKATFRE